MNFYYAVVVLVSTLLGCQSTGSRDIVNPVDSPPRFCDSKASVSNCRLRLMGSPCGQLGEQCVQIEKIADTLLENKAAEVWKCGCSTRENLQ